MARQLAAPKEPKLLRVFVEQCDEVPIRLSSVIRRSLLAKVEGVNNAVFWGEAGDPDVFGCGCGRRRDRSSRNV